MMDKIRKDNISEVSFSSERGKLKISVPVATEEFTYDIKNLLRDKAIYEERLAVINKLILEAKNLGLQ